MKDSLAWMPMIIGAKGIINSLAYKGITPLPALQSNTEAVVAVRCAIAACAVVRGKSAEVAAWRKQAVAMGPEAMPASFLKHADEQTVVAIEAVRVALTSIEQRPDFQRWGVIAGADFFGREKCARAIQAFPTDGAWGVSPHLIPHQSIHAISGTLSQALKAHGSNFGVGSGANALPDAFLFASSLALDDTLPGFWLVLAGHESEYIPSEDITDPCAIDRIGVAFALVPTLNPTCRGEIRFCKVASETELYLHADPTIDSLADAVARRQSSVVRLGESIVAEIDFVGDVEGR